MTTRALITGAAGQDGTYLTELLIGKGYEVYGVIGPAPGAFRDGIGRWGEAYTVLSADLTDMESLLRAVEVSRPDEVYNLAAQSSVGGSWVDAVTTTEVNAVGVVRLLEAVRQTAPQAHVFQAASAEMFGNGAEVPQRESTPLRPHSPYAATKAYAFHIARSYRESYGMHVSSGIMFNHESPLRGMQFVTRKITNTVARIKLGLADELCLGNLDAKRDWGFAGDYVEAMRLMLQSAEADDYVIATGEVHTVRDFCETAFSHVGLDWRRYVRTDEASMRPVDVDVLCGDSSKARRLLGWEPKVRFEELAAMMVDADMQLESQADGPVRS